MHTHDLFGTPRPIMFIDEITESAELFGMVHAVVDQMKFEL